MMYPPILDAIPDSFSKHNNLLTLSNTNDIPVSPLHCAPYMVYAVLYSPIYPDERLILIVQQTMCVKCFVSTFFIGNILFHLRPRTDCPIDQGTRSQSVFSMSKAGMASVLQVTLPSSSTSQTRTEQRLSRPIPIKCETAVSSCFPFLLL